MGADSSRIDVARMPAYFIEFPDVGLKNCGILQRSLRNMVGNIRVVGRARRVAFVDFYDAFYNRVYEVKDPELQVVSYIEDGMESKSLFLVKLLKLLVTFSQNTLLHNHKKVNQIDPSSRRMIKKFVREYRDIKIECYGPIGEALFLGVKACDEMYAIWVHEAWRNAYSLLLRHLLPLALQFRATKRFSTDSDYDLRSDFSSDISSDEDIGYDSIRGSPEAKPKEKGGKRRLSLIMRITKNKIRSITPTRPTNSSSNIRRPSRYVRKHLKDIYDITDISKEAEKIPKPPQPDRKRRHSLSEQSPSAGKLDSKRGRGLHSGKFWSHVPPPANIGSEPPVGGSPLADYSVAGSMIEEMPHIEPLPNDKATPTSGRRRAATTLNAPLNAHRRFSAELDEDAGKTASELKSRKRQHKRNKTFTSAQLFQEKDSIFQRSPRHRPSPKTAMKNKSKRVVVRRMSAPSVLVSPRDIYSNQPAE